MKCLMKQINKIYRKADELFFIFGCALFAFTLPLFSKFAFDPVFFNIKAKLDPAVAEQYGGFIGGLFGTLIGVSTTFFLLYTILSQLRTNRKNQIEAAFYKLVDYHKENVDKLAVYGSKFCVQGSEVFVVLQKKFDLIFKLVKDNSDSIDEGTLIDISYNLLFYGFNKEDNNVLRSKIEPLSNKITFEEFIDKICFNTPIVTYKGNTFSIKESNEFQLAHYFRNLFNTYGIIDGDETLSDKEKRFYLKILRTQFSTPEVWIIMLNSLSQLGNVWNEKEYIKKYSIIKNLPENYSKIIDFLKYYPDISYEFIENKKRIKVSR